MSDGARFSANRLKSPRLLTLLGAILISSIGIACIPVSMSGAVNGAPRWYSSSSPKGVAWTAVTCAPGSSDCVAAGFQSHLQVAAYSRNGGVTWARAALPKSSGSGLTEVQSASCVVSSTKSVDCAVLAGFGNGCSLEAFYSINGGATWNRTGVPRLGGANCDVLKVRCFAATTGVDCVGNAGYVLYSDNGGRNWSQSSVAGSPVQGYDFSCSPFNGSVDCVVVDRCLGESGNVCDVGYYSTDGGLSWENSTGNVTQDPLVSVSCASATSGVDCTALGVDVSSGTATTIYSVDGGATWSASSLQLSQVYGGGYEVSCGSLSSSVTCALVINTGDSGGNFNGAESLYSSDGGATWATGQFISAFSAGWAVSGNWAPGNLQCQPQAGALSCVFSDGFSEYSLNAGASWIRMSKPKGFEIGGYAVQGFDTSNCVTATQCVAVVAIGQGFSGKEGLSTTRAH